jgi:dTDP-glucose pyrophosphorylase
MNGRVRQAVVLAAGKGARLLPLSGVLPKPLAPVCNKPVMQYQLEAAAEAGIKDVLIVIGPGGEPIRRHFRDGHWLGLRIRYVEDEAPAGIAASLARTEPWVDGPMLVFLGDIFLQLRGLEPALTPLEQGADATLVVRRDRPDAVRRNFAVIADERGRVSRVIEKPAVPPTDLKGCGVYVFDPAIFEAIRRTPPSSLRNEREITDAIQTLINMGKQVYTAAVVRWEVNITYPGDLLACNLRLLREKHLNQLVGENARVNDGTRLVQSIVGARSVIHAPLELERCLVLPDTEVTDRSSTHVRGHIFADGVVWAGA